MWNQKKKHNIQDLKDPSKNNTQMKDCKMQEKRRYKPGMGDEQKTVQETAEETLGWKEPEQVNGLTKNVQI